MCFKKLLPVIALVAFQLQSIAQVQGGTNQKLAKLYNAGKYEVCFFKADDMCNDEVLSKDAEPYLYAAMCMVKLYGSEDPDIAMDYEDGMKQAVKYAQKFAKKDKEGELYTKNLEFINSLKEDLKKEIKDQFEKKAYGKVVTAAKSFDKLNREPDNVLLYYIGMCEVLSNNVGQGERDMAEAKINLKEPILKNLVVIDQVAKGFIVDGFLKFTEQMIANKKQPAAKDAITLASKIFPNDGYITVQYNLITGTKKQ